MNYFLLAHELQAKVDQLRAYNESLHTINEILRKSMHIKRQSGQFVLLKEKDGKYFDPIVVSADSCEEAFDNTEHHFVMPIPEPNEFPDL